MRGKGSSGQQDQKDKPWRNEELKKLEEDTPRLKESDFAKAAKTYKAKTGVGCDGFHPKVPLDLTRGGIPGNCGAVLMMAATSLHNAFHFDSEECHK